MDYPIDSPAQLSIHLRTLRKARGLSQAQLGAALGIGQTRIVRIEHDPTAISVEQFLGMLNALGVQMVLRADTARHGAGTAAAPARSVGTRRHGEPDDAPW